MNFLMDNLVVIKNTLHDINEELLQIKSEERRVLTEYRETVQELYRSILGNCYKRVLEDGSAQYFCVVDVPQYVMTPMKNDFNPYQIPCLVVDPVKGSDNPSELFEELCDCVSFQTVFARCLPEVTSPSRSGPEKKLEKITQDEFRTALSEVFARFDRALVWAGARRPPQSQTEF